MSGANSPQGGLTRRSFLKTTAAVAGAAAVTVGATSTLTALAEEEHDVSGGKDEIFYGACRPNCSGGCFLKIHKRDGHIVRTSMAEMPNPAYNRICIRGLSHVYRIYDDNRLKYPLRRVEGTERGAGQWERITWDEALDEIAEKWTRYIRDYGEGSILFMPGSGSYGSVSGSAFYSGMHRLMNCVKGRFLQQDYDQAGSIGPSRVYGSSGANSPVDLSENCKLFVFWGTNQTEAYPHLWHFRQEAKERGAKLVTIDPIYNVTASKSDMWVPIKPGTDGYLALAMINHIIQSNLYEEDFLLTQSVASFLVGENGKFLRGKDCPELSAPSSTDYVVWDSEAGTVSLLAEAQTPSLTLPEGAYSASVGTAFDLLAQHVSSFTTGDAAHKCGLEESQIIELIDLWVNHGPVRIDTAFGADHYVNAHYAYIGMAILNVLTGNFGKPGTGMGSYGGSVMSVSNSKAHIPEGGKDNTYPMITFLRFPEVIEEKKYGKDTIDCHCWINFRGNPLGNHLERQTLLKTLEKIEFVVTVDMVMSDTTMYSDLVLPAAHWFEQEDMMGTYASHPFLIHQEKVQDPPYESHSDFWIYRNIAERMGLGEMWAYETEADYMKALLDCDAARQQGITYDRLCSEHIVSMMEGKPEVYGESGVYGTATKRLEIYVENPQPLRNWGQELDYEKEHLPQWMEPNEASEENPLFEKYPMFCVQEHTKWRCHTQWGHVQTLRELDPEPTVKMNPVDAEPRGIKEGDYVRIFNDRGFVVVKAIFSEALRPGVLNIPKGWQADQFKAGHYSNLTNRTSHPFLSNSPFFDFLCDIEKYEDEV